MQKSRLAQSSYLDHSNVENQVIVYERSKEDSMSSIHQSGEHMIRLAYKNSNKDEDKLMKNYLSKHGKLCKFNYMFRAKLWKY